MGGGAGVEGGSNLKDKNGTLFTETIKTQQCGNALRMSFLTNARFSSSSCLMKVYLSLSSDMLKVCTYCRTEKLAVLTFPEYKSTE